MKLESLNAYENAYRRSVEDPEGFWAEVARGFTWQQPFTEVCAWDFEGPSVRWFADGVVNITENVLDRHLASRAGQIAIHWEPNDPTSPRRSFTYQQLHDEVCRVANGLKAQGFGRGDRIVLYMPMVPNSCSRCWRARGSAPFTAWSLRASARTRWRTGSTMPAPWRC